MQTAPQSLVALLEYRAEHTPDAVAFVFLRDGQNEEVTVTYRELAAHARQIAGVVASVAAPGDRVLICHAPGEPYIASFFGCLYAGAIAVPVYPPRFDRKLDRLNGIAVDAKPRAALTSTSILSNLKELLPQSPELSSLTWIDIDILGESRSEPLTAAIQDSSLAFIQYTSGSTSQPKGVLLSHSNLLANMKCIKDFFQLQPHHLGMSWLPPYHDMGLIGGILTPIYRGIPTILMSPYAFAQRPIRWLRAVTKYRVTHSGGPNFAYALCVDRIKDEQLTELDLSSWQLAYCGAEPIRADVIERFVTKFAPCGFRRESFYPCYGMAEATLIVTGHRAGVAPTVLHIDPERLQRDHLAVTDTSSSSRVQSIVGCGTPPESHVVKIVDRLTHREQPEGRVGEIWFSGPSVAKGYWNHPDETARSFSAKVAGAEDDRSYLRTGDSGFVRAGEFFITGRIKDLIIVRGRNLYPQDIELTVERSHPILRPGAGAAFALLNQKEERLVLLHEIERNSEDANLDEVIEAIRRRVVEDHGVEPFAISLLQRNTLPLTSSGKIQRHASREQFINGELIERKRFLLTDSI